MAGAGDHEISVWCQGGEHELCPHKLGGGVHLFRRADRAVAVLCPCGCHRSCPVGGRREVPDGEWLAGCTCPGSDLAREVDLRVRHRIDAHRARQEEVFRDVDFGRGKSAGEIQEEILSAYAAHGYEPPSDYRRWSRFIAAATGRRGTRRIRVLGETARGLRAVARSTPVASDDPDEVNSDAHTAREMRSMRRAFAAYSAGAVALIVGASVTGGIVQIVLAVLAALVTAIALWVGLWALGVGLLVRFLRSHPWNRSR